MLVDIRHIWQESNLGQTICHIHNKVLDFVTLDNYKANSQSFQVHWSLDHYKTALDGVSVILEGLVPIIIKMKFLVVIPYIKGVSEELRRLFKRYEVAMYFKPTNTLRQLLVSPKDKLKKERVIGLVYQIPCKKCPATIHGWNIKIIKTTFLRT